ncbi:MAG: sigma-70 family RNA polymerase sigma factor [Chloroflexi bacterium]|nr:sigma-70 family RNA polymerase sigma factor [Chloroflexota bacterium]
MVEPLLLNSAPPDTDQEDDRLALQAYKDPQAFGALYRRYVSRVYRYLYGKTGCVEDAEDLTAQVFSEALESLPRYRPRGKFAGWLFTIARRRLLNSRRNQNETLPLTAVEDKLGQVSDTLGRIIQAERIERLKQLLQTLDDEEAELLRLHYYAGLTYAQIGDVLEKREAAVGMAMHRLLRRLEALWDHLDSGEVENE